MQMAVKSLEWIKASSIPHYHFLSVFPKENLLEALWVQPHTCKDINFNGYYQEEAALTETIIESQQSKLSPNTCNRIYIMHAAHHGGGNENHG